MMGETPSASPPSLADLPPDELFWYARELGLRVDRGTPPSELLRLVRQRQELLMELERDALLDIVVWARVPVRQSAGKEALARAIAGIGRSDFEALSDRGLRALARLRNLPIREDETRQTLERRLQRQEGLWARLKRRQQEMVGGWIARVVEGKPDDGEYRFLPEQEGGESLRKSIRDVGVVEGIAQRIRGVADQYVEQKLDEIEQRIDRKLDEIDRRLCEWRDQEIRNRLRIVKITLVTAIVVAVISLGYDYLRVKGTEPNASALPVAQQRNDEGS